MIPLIFTIVLKCKVDIAILKNQLYLCPVNFIN